MQVLRRMKGIFLVFFLAVCCFMTTEPVKADYVSGQVRVKVIYRNANTREEVVVGEDQFLRVSFYRNQQLLGSMHEVGQLGSGEYSLNTSFGIEEVEKLEAGNVIGFMPQLPRGYVADGMPEISVMGMDGTGNIQSAVVEEADLQWDDQRISFAYTADMAKMQKGNLEILLTCYVGKTSDQKQLTEANVRTGIGSAEYTGKPVKPDELVVKRNNTTLKEGRDYTCTYSDNVEVGEAVAQVKGIGEYTGSVRLSYGIMPKDLSGNDVLITAKDQPYEGKKVTPEITVTVAGKKLTEGKEYTVQYLADDSAFERAGEIVFFVNGLGNYSGGKEGKFQIFTSTGKPVVKPAVKYTVKFSAGSGKVKGSSSKKVEKNKAYGKLPTAVRKGYAFKGWYTKKSGGKKVTALTKANISKNQTLYAQWTKVKAPSRVKTPVLKNLDGRNMSVKLKKVSLAKGYEICYSTNAKFKDAKKVRTTKLNVTVKNLKKNKIYYVKARAYKLDSAKQKVYGSYSKPVRVKIKK